MANDSLKNLYDARTTAALSEDFDDPGFDAYLPEAERPEITEPAPLSESVINGGGSKPVNPGPKNPQPLKNMTASQPAPSPQQVAEPVAEPAQETPVVANQPAPEVAPQDNGDYDMEGYTTKYGKPDQSQGQHLTDEFKKPNHITFSEESRYSTPEQKGGRWEKNGDGTWNFYASEFNLQQHSKEEIQQYFKKFEPGNTVYFPKSEPVQPEASVSGQAPVSARDNDLRSIPKYVMPSEFRGWDMIGQMSESQAVQFAFTPDFTQKDADLQEMLALDAKLSNNDTEFKKRAQVAAYGRAYKRFVQEQTSGKNWETWGKYINPQEIPENELFQGYVKEELGNIHEKSIDPNLQQIVKDGISSVKFYSVVDDMLNGLPGYIYSTRKKSDFSEAMAGANSSSLGYLIFGLTPYGGTATTVGMGVSAVVGAVENVTINPKFDELRDEFPRFANYLTGAQFLTSFLYGGAVQPIAEHGVEKGLNWLFTSPTADKYNPFRLLGEKWTETQMRLLTDGSLSGNQFGWRDQLLESLFSKSKSEQEHLYLAAIAGKHDAEQAFRNGGDVSMYGFTNPEIASLAKQNSVLAPVRKNIQDALYGNNHMENDIARREIELEAELTEKLKIFDADLTYHTIAGIKPGVDYAVTALMGSEFKEKWVDFTFKAYMGRKAGIQDTPELIDEVYKLGRTPTEKELKGIVKKIANDQVTKLYSAVEDHLYTTALMETGFDARTYGVIKDRADELRATAMHVVANREARAQGSELFPELDERQLPKELIDYIDNWDPETWGPIHQPTQPGDDRFFEIAESLFEKDLLKKSEDVKKIGLSSTKDFPAELGVNVAYNPTIKRLLAIDSLYNEAQQPGALKEANMNLLQGYRPVTLADHNQALARIMQRASKVKLDEQPDIFRLGKLFDITGPNNTDTIQSVKYSRENDLKNILRSATPEQRTKMKLQTPSDYEDLDSLTRIFDPKSPEYQAAKSPSLTEAIQLAESSSDTPEQVKTAIQRMGQRREDVKGESFTIENYLDQKSGRGEIGDQVGLRQSYENVANYLDKTLYKGRESATPSQVLMYLDKALAKNPPDNPQTRAIVELRDAITDFQRDSSKVGRDRKIDKANAHGEELQNKQFQADRKLIDNWYYKKQSEADRPAFEDLKKTYGLRSQNLRASIENQINSWDVPGSLKNAYKEMVASEADKAGEAGVTLADKALVNRLQELDPSKLDAIESLPGLMNKLFPKDQQSLILNQVLNRPDRSFQHVDGLFEQAISKLPAAEQEETRNAWKAIQDNINEIADSGKKPLPTPLLPETTTTSISPSDIEGVDQKFKALADGGKYTDTLSNMTNMALDKDLTVEQMRNMPPEVLEAVQGYRAYSQFLTNRLRKFTNKPDASLDELLQDKTVRSAMVADKWIKDFSQQLVGTRDQDLGRNLALGFYDRLNGTNLLRQNLESFESARTMRFMQYYQASQLGRQMDMNEVTNENLMKVQQYYLDSLQDIRPDNYQQFVKDVRSIKISTDENGKPFYDVPESIKSKFNYQNYYSFKDFNYHIADVTVDPNSTEQSAIINRVVNDILDISGTNKDLSQFDSFNMPSTGNILQVNPMGPRDFLQVTQRRSWQPQPTNVVRKQIEHELGVTSSLDLNNNDVQALYDYRNTVMDNMLNSMKKLESQSSYSEMMSKGKAASDLNIDYDATFEKHNMTQTGIHAIVARKAALTLKAIDETIQGGQVTPATLKALRQYGTDLSSPASLLKSMDNIMTNLYYDPRIGMTAPKWDFLSHGDLEELFKGDVEFIKAISQITKVAKGSLATRLLNKSIRDYADNATKAMSASANRKQILHSVKAKLDDVAEMDADSIGRYAAQGERDHRNANIDSSAQEDYYNGTHDYNSGEENAAE